MERNVIGIGLLIYSKELDRVFCFCCKVFKSGIGKGQLANEDFSDWSHVGRRLKEHETSLEHVKSMTTWYELRQRLNSFQTIDKTTQRLIEKEKDHWKSGLKSFFLLGAHFYNESRASNFVGTALLDAIGILDLFGNAKRVWFRSLAMGLSGGAGRRLYAKLITAANYASSTAASNEMNLIKQLRESTGAPIKDVKAALVDSNWDIDAAQKELRKKGIILASKKSSRTASEGLLALAQNHSKTAVIELNCETDFVARNDIFQHLARSLANQALLLDHNNNNNSSFHFGPQSFQEMRVNLQHPKINGETTVQNAITEVAAMMGENVKLRRGYVMPAPSHGLVSTYLHTSPQPGLGRIAGILSLEVDGGKTQADALQRVGSELAMHVVAAKPLFLTKEHVSSDALKIEREILKSQAEASGKSQMVIDKMVEGRLRKYFEDVVLMDQKFVMNDTMKVKAVLDNLSKEVGSSVRVVSFLRMEVGEGIARQEIDSSESVAQVA